MRRTEIGVGERRLEAGQGLDLVQEGFFAARTLVTIEQRQDDSPELVALFAVRASQSGRGATTASTSIACRASRKARTPSESSSTSGAPSNEPVDDERRLAQDVLEARHRDREERREPRQELDFLPDLLDGELVPRPPHHPLVVEDQDLEVLAFVDLAQAHCAAHSSACGRPLRRAAACTSSTE